MYKLFVIDILLLFEGVHCSMADLKKFIGLMDKDRNGVIDFSEWRDFLLVIIRLIIIIIITIPQIPLLINYYLGY